MPPEAADHACVQSMARFVATHIGLHFPPGREADLLRGLQGAAKEAGHDSVADYCEWLLSRPPPPSALHQLASHLTIGETYFFREEQALRALSQHILPPLIHARRGGTRHLRLWSAACSTGEEAYSLAIMLHELLPDRNDWQVTLMATDINQRSLEKARTGVYGEWSFRALAPELRARYFTAVADRRFAINDDIKRRVTFSTANLAADSAPEYPADALDMDVILCRNLLIYFTAEQGHKLVEKLRAALAPGGCLAVSPSEFSQYLFSGFVALNFPGTVLYRRPLPGERTAEQPPAGRTTTAPLVRDAQQWRPAEPAARRYAQAISTPAIPAPALKAPDDHASRARALANLGKLDDALASCEKWIKADKVNPAAHYLHATVLQELGDRDEAQRSLQRCIYLQPQFALAHVALGNLARSAGRQAESQRHYRNARRLLEAQRQDAPLPESEGVSAGRMAAIVRSLLEPDDAATTAPENNSAFR